MQGNTAIFPEFFSPLQIKLQSSTNSSSDQNDLLETKAEDDLCEVLPIRECQQRIPLRRFAASSVLCAACGIVLLDICSDFLHWNWNWEQEFIITITARCRLQIADSHLGPTKTIDWETHQTNFHFCNLQLCWYVKVILGWLRNCLIRYLILLVI